MSGHSGWHVRTTSRLHLAESESETDSLPSRFAHIRNLFPISLYWDKTGVKKATSDNNNDMLIVVIG